MKIIQNNSCRFKLEPVCLSGIYVPDETYVNQGELFISYERDMFRVYKMLRGGIPLPRGAHHTLIDALFWAAKEK